MKIDILGISDTRWRGKGKTKSYQEIYVYYTGEDKTNSYRVAIANSKDVAKCVKNFSSVSNRICILQLKACPTDIKIIQVYAPT